MQPGKEFRAPRNKGRPSRSTLFKDDLNLRIDKADDHTAL